VILPGDKINIEFNKLHETESFLKLKVIYQIKKCLTFHVAEISLSWSKQQPLFLILSHTISLRSALILSSHLSLALPSGLFPSRFHMVSTYSAQIENEWQPLRMRTFSW